MLLGFGLPQCGEEGIREAPYDLIGTVVICLADVQMLALQRLCDPHCTGNPISFVPFDELLLPRLGSYLWGTPWGLLAS